MMKKLAFAGLAIGMCFSAPALALEHEIVIDHPAGPIAADYEGSVRVETRQVGTAGVAGRPSTLRCQWSAALDLERTAKLGETLQTRRVMTRDDVASGSTSGWCSSSARTIDRLVEARRDSFRSAMLAMVEQDRTIILAEAENAAVNGRDG
ncbi:MAG: hypothetical protein NXH71_09985 [Erythrobacteraceae bacterium]|jgi:hypothetical protein|nr:hypothetical protein [Erythrobacteraceae bacterium]